MTTMPEHLVERLRRILADDAAAAGPGHPPPAEPDADDTEIKADDLVDALGDDDTDDSDDGDDEPEEKLGVAGLALVAADTGRVLMLQRALDDDNDPAAGTWEFPGGHVEPGDATSLHAAMREWSEEVGLPVPTGGHVQHVWTAPNGIYHGHVVVIPRESALDLGADRVIDNPDDDSEQVAWWDPDDARRNPALRKECAKTPWAALKAARERAQEKGIPLRLLEVKDQKPGAAPVANTGAPKASASTLAGSGAAASTIPEKGKGGKKRKVASKAGEARYGLPIGTELGQARDDAGGKAQSDEGSKKLYDKLRGTNPRDYRAMLDGLNDADLGKLAQFLYSARSSNPAVVQARIAVAGALRRKGKSVDDYGGLGKGRAGGRASKAPGKAKAKAPAKPPDATWLPGEGWQARKARRAKLGLSGGEGTRPPAAKTKRGEGGRTMTLHVYEDGSWQYKSIDPGRAVEPEGWVLVESKAAPTGGEPTVYLDDVELKRTTTKPWESRKAQRAGKTIGKENSTDKDGGDEYPIKNIGDLATAIKRAKNIKDPDRLKTVRAHIRSRASAINASNMIPKDWSGGGSSDGGKGSGKASGKPWEKGKKDAGEGPLEFADLASYAAYIEGKAMSPDPRAAKLREYWAHGEGRKKWRPGSGGDFERLRRQLAKYVPKHMLNGLTANIHKLATGEWPGKHAHGAKSADPDAAVITAVELAEFKMMAAVLDRDDEDALTDPMGDDAVTMSLDAYSDLADQLTSEDEYESALARNIDWDLLADGSLTETEEDPPESVERARAAVAQDDHDDEGFDPDAALDMWEDSVLGA